MRDFTLNIYKELLTTIIDFGYSIIPLEDYLSDNNLGDKLIIIRHDVDRKPFNALKMAKLENELGIKASYYFRIVKKSYDENIIKEIVKLGHKIGYHYEDLSLVKGNYEKAIYLFKKNLDKLRKNCEIKTICMHGSPLSKWDNRLIWNKIDYKNHGIIGEPYYDINFNEFLYLTDTGRRWNGKNVNIRDKVSSAFYYDFKKTDEIITGLQHNNLPKQIMLNIHPLRWTDSFMPWIKELIWQNTKNVTKYLLAKW